MNPEDRYRQATDELWREDPHSGGKAVIGLLLAAATFLAFLLWLSGFAVASERTYEGRYGETHKEYHQQYMKMHNQLGTHCCNNQDCTRTTARFDHSTGRWQALVEGIWRDIAADRHVKDAYGLTEHAHVCFNPSTTPGKEYIYCFVPPSMGG